MTHTEMPDCVARLMGLELDARRVIKKEMRSRVISRASRSQQGAILDELCGSTGFARRKSLPARLAGIEPATRCLEGSRSVR